MAEKRRIIQKINATIEVKNPIEIMAVGDLHLGAADCDLEMINKIAKWVNAKDNRFIVIAGDIFNAALKTSVSDVYEETMTVQESLDVFKEFIIKLRKDSVIGVTSGNHDRRIKKATGFDVAAVACELTGLNYLGAEGFILVKVGQVYKSGKGQFLWYKLYVTHGSGGGSTIGGAVNGMMKLHSIVDADIYIQGHTHKPSIVPSSIYRITSNGRNVVEAERMSMTCAACTTRSEYAKEFAFAPTARLCPVVHLSNKTFTMSGELVNLQ